jgi:hypothetical protein
MNVYFYQTISILIHPAHDSVGQLDCHRRVHLIYVLPLMSTRVQSLRDLCSIGMINFTSNDPQLPEHRS